MRKAMMFGLLALATICGNAGAQFYNRQTGRDIFGDTPGDIAARQQAQQLKKANELKEQELKQSWTMFVSTIALVGCAIAVAGAAVGFVIYQRQTQGSPGSSPAAKKEGGLTSGLD